MLNEQGERVERYGHASDCFDYAMVYFLAKEYQTFKSKEVDVVTTVDVGSVVYAEFEY